MSSSTPWCLTRQHLELFGTIVQWFARHELLMQEIMASVSGADVGSIVRLTRNQDFPAQLATLRDLLHHHTVPLNQVDEILAYLTLLGTFAPLLHDIVHSSWVQGRPPDSIQPEWILRRPSEVEPVREDMHLPSRAFLHRERDEANFSIDDLELIVRQLSANHAGLSGYLYEIGLVRRHADQR